MPSPLIFGHMIQRLPVFCVLFLTSGLAWLFLINWKFPVLNFAGFFNSELKTIDPKPEWVFLSNQMIGSFLLVILLSVILRIKMIRHLLIALLVIIIFLAVTDFLGKFPNVHELLEHGIRYATPVSLLLILNNKTTNLLPVLKIGIAATFAGHGIYALGIPQVPTNFIEMTINITGWSQEGAIQFLFIIGILDILAAAGIFFKTSIRISLWYCIIWGFLTALARILAYTHLGIEEVFVRWVPEMILRLPNSLIPLWVLLTFDSGRQNN